MAEAKDDFFISYTHVDRAWAEWLAWQLEAADWHVRIQAWDFRPGENFVLRMHEAAESERTIAVLTPAYLQALYTAPEWAAAFADDPTGAQTRLVPVRVRPCELTGLLRPIVHIDLVGLGEDEAREALLAGVRRGRAKPAARPPFPGADPAPSGRERPPFPGAMTATRSSPTPSRSFTGREELLRDLVAGFAQRDSTRRRVQVLHGLGGVGKTQTAARFVADRQQDYDVVWWIRAEEEQTRLADYAQLAVAVGLPEHETVDETAAVEAVMRWLSQQERWLLVFDNAPDANALTGLIPSDLRGDVLVTTRRATAWRSFGEPRAVGVWQRAESTAFLRERTGDVDEGAADAVAEALGDLPLALEQAGAYVDTTGIALADYRERLEQHAPALFATETSSDYGKTVATTWEMAFREVEADTASGSLVQACATMSPEPLPMCVIERLLPDALERDRVLTEVLRFSLLTPGAESVTMHRLVQQVVRRRMSDGEKGTAAARAAKALGDALPVDAQRASWPTYVELLPHVAAVLEVRTSLRKVDGIMLSLVEKMESFHYERGEYARAIPLARISLHWMKIAHGEESGEVAFVLNRLGVLQVQVGDPASGEQLLQEACDLMGRAGVGPEERAQALCNLGTARSHCGDFAGARDCNLQALEVFEGLHGRDSPLIAPVLSNLGAEVRKLGEPAEARQYHERALQLLGEDADPRDVATTLANLGEDLVAEGDLSGAQSNFKRALDLLVDTLGEDHVAVAEKRMGLGTIYARQHDAPAARAEMEEALAIMRRYLPEEHPSIARTIGNLANVHVLEGDLPMALERHERALEMLEARLGPDHPDLAIGLASVAVILREMGDEDRAAACAERAAALTEPSLGGLGASRPAARTHSDDS